MNRIRFGPGGNSQSFYKDNPKKSSLEACRWLFAKGLDAYEYECTRGVKISKEFAVKLGKEAKACDVALSLHAPYYINLAAINPEKQQASMNHLLKSLEAANWMGATKVVFHPGSGNPAEEGDTREKALERAKALFEKIIEQATQLELLEDVYLAPETMGKKNQLGNLDEVIALCKEHPGVAYPTIDWAHLYALGNGGLQKEEDFAIILEKIEQALGDETCQHLHCHFSPIEYTVGGEKRHRNLSDEIYGPDFSLLKKIINRQSSASLQAHKQKLLWLLSICIEC